MAGGSEDVVDHQRDCAEREQRDQDGGIGRIEAAHVSDLQNHARLPDGIQRGIGVVEGKR